MGSQKKEETYKLKMRSQLDLFLNHFNPVLRKYFLKKEKQEIPFTLSDYLKDKRMLAEKTDAIKTSNEYNSSYLYG